MKIVVNSLVAALVLSSSLSALEQLPSFKFKNDFRVRYQHQNQESSESRSRLRYRLRLSTAATLSEQTQVKVRLASGSEDPRSTNNTVDDSFSKSDLRLDYSYIEHTLSPDVHVLAGKMKNPLWRPVDMLWDTDISPDGAALSYSAKFSGYSIFLTSAFFVLDELKEEEDPYLFAVQSGLKRGRLTLAGSLYHAGNGSSSESSVLNTDITALVLTTQLKGAKITPFAELVINTEESEANKGGVIGAKFGKSSLKQKGDWKVKANYRYLQSNAWLDTLPDSDAYSGNTNSHGLELSVAYGLSRFSSLVLDVYSMDVISGESDNQLLVQLDLKTKF